MPAAKGMPFPVGTIHLDIEYCQRGIQVVCHCGWGGGVITNYLTYFLFSNPNCCNHDLVSKPQKKGKEKRQLTFHPTLLIGAGPYRGPFSPIGLSLILIFVSPCAAPEWIALNTIYLQRIAHRLQAGPHKGSRMTRWMCKATNRRVPFWSTALAAALLLPAPGAPVLPAFLPEFLQSVPETG
jgi:hypothetical protein